MVRRVVGQVWSRVGTVSSARWGSPFRRAERMIGCAANLASIGGPTRQGDRIRWVADPRASSRTMLSEPGSSPSRTGTLPNRCLPSSAPLRENPLSRQRRHRRENVIPLGWRGSRETLAQRVHTPRALNDTTPAAWTGVVVCWCRTMPVRRQARTLTSATQRPDPVPVAGFSSEFAAGFIAAATSRLSISTMSGLNPLWIAAILPSGQMMKVVGMPLGP